MTKIISCSIIIAILFVIIVSNISVVSIVHAANISVGTTIPDINPDGICSLIEAIVNANNDASTHSDCLSGSGTDVIELMPGVYSLTSVHNSTLGDNGLPPITSAIIINGNGAIIERSTAVNIPRFRIFLVDTGGILTLNELTIRNGRLTSAGGAGILNRNGTLTLNNTTISNNNATSYSGGGIENRDGTVTVNNSTISDNYGGNLGGGISNSTSSGQTTTTVNNSTISNNLALTGGGIFSARFGPGPPPVINLNSSTVASNTATSTLQGGGGIRNSTDSIINFRNSLIAGNIAPIGPDCYQSGGTITSLGYNLMGSNANCSFTSGTGDRINIDPLLGPLQDNGGTTLTHAILPPSLAINGGNPTGCIDDNGNTLAYDQRGMPRRQGIRCDIGAYEAQVELSLIKTVDNILPVRGQIITYTLTLNNSGVLTGTNLLISDTLPISLAFVGPLRLFPSNVILPAPISSVLASGLTIAPSQQISLTFPVTVDNGVAEGTFITNTASVTSSEVITPVMNKVRIIVAHISNLPLILKN